MIDSRSDQLNGSIDTIKAKRRINHGIVMDDYNIIGLSENKQTAVVSL